jgi:hypothetical protein
MYYTVNVQTAAQAAINIFCGGTWLEVQSRLLSTYIIMKINSGFLYSL